MGMLSSTWHIVSLNISKFYDRGSLFICLMNRYGIWGAGPARLMLGECACFALLIAQVWAQPQVLVLLCPSVWQIWPESETLVTKKKKIQRYPVVTNLVKCYHAQGSGFEPLFPFWSFMCSEVSAAVFSVSSLLILSYQFLFYQIKRKNDCLKQWIPLVGVEPQW